MKWIVPLIAGVLLGTWVALRRPPAAPTPARAGSRLPLAFEKNVGQTDETARFVARTRAGQLFLTDEGPVFSSGVHIKASGSRPVAPEGTAQLPGIASYYVGNAPDHWHTDIPTFSRVKMKDVYPGISWVFYGDDRRLEYDFEVAPGADPSVIRLTFEGVDDVRLTADGRLLLSAAGRELEASKPRVYQDVDGVRREIDAAYALSSGEGVAFALGAFDRHRTLVIDPTLSYLSYFGGGGNDVLYGIALDADGGIYLAGHTDSLNFPRRTPAQPSFGGGLLDAFVSKLDPSGTSVVYSTYLGGSGEDAPTCIAVDSAGNAYVAGYSFSANFPTVGALQPTLSGTRDVTVTKLNGAGALVYSTFVGGSQVEDAHGIKVTAAGEAIVCGQTTSNDFPLAAAVQTTFYGNSYDVFALKLNAAGTALVYSTYLGGSAQEYCADLALDGAGNAYFTGQTASSNFPTMNALQSTLSTPNDFYLVKLKPDGGWVYSTLLGGNGDDFATGVAVDATGAPTLVGTSKSSNFPGVSDPRDGGSDLLIVRLNPSATAVTMARMMGGSLDDIPTAVMADSAGGLTVAATTLSPDFPASTALAPFVGGTSGVLLKVTATGTVLYASFVGGISGALNDAALDRNGAVHAAGRTTDATLTTVAAWQSRLDGGEEGLLITLVPPPYVVSVAPSSGPAGGGTAVALSGTTLLAGLQVRFGGSAATVTGQPSPDSAAVTSPAHAVGAVDLVVTNADGQAFTLPGAFTYVAPPTLGSVLPVSGPSTGGTDVTLTGTDFLDGGTVSFGGTLATQTTPISSSVLRATTPAHAAGAVDVTVTNPDGQTSTLTAAFTFVPAPTPSVVMPASGPVAGGTAFTVSGSNFATGASVTFGGVAATSVQVAGPTQLTGVTPASVAGAVDVTVTNPGGQSGTLAGAFTFVPPPRITRLMPSSVSTAGGTAVTVEGTGFLDGAAVTVDGLDAGAAAVQGAGALSFTTPAHAAGPVDVEVVNPDGQRDTAATALTYVAPDAPGCTSDDQCPDGVCRDGACVPRDRTLYRFCSVAPAGPLLAVLALLLVRRRRAGVLLGLVLAVPSFGAEKLKLGFIGLTSDTGVPPQDVQALSEALQSELVAAGAYDVVSRSDIAAMLGIERQKQLLGCNDEGSTCFAEMADALNAERVVSGTVNLIDGRYLFSASLASPRKATVIHRASRAEGSLGSLLDEMREVAYELINSDEPFRAAPLKLERGFGGVLVGVRGDVDLLGVAVAPGITVELSARRWFGGALTVLPKAIPGVRLEARFYPVTANRLRLWVAAGLTAFTEGLGPRGGLGVSVRFDHLQVFADLAYERFFPLKPYNQLNAVVFGLGLGWLF